MLEDRRQALLPLLADENPEIQQAAATTLDALDAVANLDQLLQQLQSGTRGERIAAAFALEQINVSGVFPPLLAALQDGDPDLRVVVVQVLGSKKHPKTIGPLVKMLADPEPGVQVETIRVLAGFGDRRLCDYLAPFVAVADEQVAVAAIEALGTLTFPEGEKPLLAALRDSRPRVRLLATKMLGRLGL